MLLPVSPSHISGVVAIDPKTTLETYLSEINRYPLLAPDEENQHARRIRQGDVPAREAMIRSNLRLVVSIAKLYVNRGLSFMDLIEEGNLGLLKAVERFDPDQDCRFSTYATWWIKQAIRRALINSVKTVRIPSYMVEIIAKWKNISMELSYRLGRQPSIAEVAHELRISKESIGLIKRAISTSASSGQMISLDMLLSSNDVIEDLNSKKPDEEIFDEYEIEKLRELLSAIDEREAMILKLRFGLGEQKPMTLKEIGKIIGLTRERIRQIENEALKKLNQIINSDNTTLR